MERWQVSITGGQVSITAMISSHTLSLTQVDPLPELACSHSLVLDKYCCFSFKTGRISPPNEPFPSNPQWRTLWVSPLPATWLSIHQGSLSRPLLNISSSEDFQVGLVLTHFPADEEGSHRPTSHKWQSCVWTLGVWAQGSALSHWAVSLQTSQQ